MTRPRSPTLNESDLLRNYSVAQRAHLRYLARRRVKLPGLKRNKQYTRAAIVLATLVKYIGRWVTKRELTRIVLRWYPGTTDVQEGRHLSAQSGWDVVSTRRGDIRAIGGPADAYKLMSVRRPYPHFRAMHPATDRDLDDEAFARLKRHYNYRCATCGSVEGKPNLVRPGTTTKLDKAHMDPKKGLVDGNVIPQCSACNGPYLRKFVFDTRGRVRDINWDDPHWRRRLLSWAKRVGLVRVPSTRAVGPRRAR